MVNECEPPLRRDPLPSGRMVLLEASAGTGKTYQIEELVLGEIAFGRADLRKILVLTYTEAATAELRHRIRSRLRSAASQLRSGQITEDIFLDAHLPVEARGGAWERLEEALSSFDDARIFTIHGFCQRVLTEFAIESDWSFESVLLEDERTLVREATQDYWLALQVDPGDAREVLLRHWGVGIPELSSLLSRRLAFPLAPISCHPPVPEDVDFDGFGIERLREEVDAFREAFLIEGEILDQAFSDRKTFSQDNKSGFGPVFRESLRSAIHQPAEPLCPRELQSVKWLTLDYLEGRLKKGAQLGEAIRTLNVPRLAARVREKIAALHWAWLRDFLDRGVRTVNELKSRSNVKAFQDLLQDLHQGLRGPRGSFLRKAVSERFSTVLIDEFQDTDFLQWEIFDDLFRTPAHRLFVIGDPKQAIYDFRGADVHAYLRAAALADERRSLDWNYRSDANLVEAVNQFFLTHSHPFGSSGVEYRRVGAKRTSRFRTAAGSPVPPFQVRAIDRQVSRADDIRTAVERQVVADIADLLASRSELAVGDEPRMMGPKDIAVLVRKGRQARSLRHCLLEAGIPAVVSSDESVFDSEEASELAFLLKSILQPGDRGLLRRVLLGLFFEVDPALLAESEVEEIDALAPRLKIWRERWLTLGVAALLRTVFDETGVIARLLRRAKGERAVTNCFHLLEVLHGADSRMDPGEEGLVSWLEERILDPETRSREEHELRAESDHEAVQIITLHRSKGLEFPVVFLPFAWEGDPGGRSRGKGSLEKMHHQDGQLQLVFAPDAGNGPWVGENEEAESRLLYVGLTRAQVCQYLYLPLCGRPTPNPLARALGVTDSGAAAAKLQSLAGAHPELFNLVVCARDPEQPLKSEQPDASSDGRLRPAMTPPEVGRLAMMTSFSALIANRQVERPDHDDWVAAVSPDDLAGVTEGDLTDLPAGAQSGSLLHEILQDWDFSDPSTSRRYLPQQLRRFGVDGSQWPDRLGRFLERLGSLTIGATQTGQFRLEEIPPHRLVRETEFTLPVSRLTPSDLGGALEGEPEWLKGGTDQLRFIPIEGFLKGFIDLVVGDGEGYWLLDWKSNDLGSQATAYSRDRLLQEMTRHHYGLQGALYTLALHRYLSAADPGYSYERNFRGALYLFLRGTDLRAPENGVVSFKLQRKTLDRLDRLCR